MRILLVPAAYAPRVGGMETAVAHLAEQLTRKGHHVAIVTNRYPRHLARFEEIDGIPVHRVLMPDLVPSREQLPRLGRYLVGVALAPIQTARLVQLGHVLRPEITNAHYLGVPALYAWGANRLGRASRFVLSVHGSDLVAGRYPSGCRQASAFVAEHADAVTACSADLRTHLEPLVSANRYGRILVTGNGVDPSEFQGREPYRHVRPYIFTSARLVPLKRVDLLIQALRHLLTSGLDVDLVIAGRGPVEESLRTLAQELALQERVRFWGYANREDMAALLKGCALFVLPSVREGFGISILEAMACGRAVVACRTGGIPEVVREGESGLLVPPGDVQALGEAIAGLLRDPERCEAMGRQGWAIAAREFSWSSVADRYLQAYAMALNS